jgi:hypothetical protein
MKHQMKELHQNERRIETKEPSKREANRNENIMETRNTSKRETDWCSKRPQNSHPCMFGGVKFEAYFGDVFTLFCIVL